MKKLLLAISLFASISSFAVQLTKQPTASLWIAPKNYNGTFTSEVGDSTAPPATWNIAQWNIPQELQGTKTAPGGSSWATANGYGSVRYYPGTGAYELAQSGATLPACGVEYDLFLAPNDPGNYPGYPAGMIASGRLNTLSSVKMSFGFNPIYENVASRCSDVNFTAYMAAVILSNPVNGQTLFMQFDVRDSRNEANTYRSWCPSYETNEAPKSFCLDTDIRNFGATRPVVGGGRKYYSFDIYNELKGLIQSGHKKALGSSANYYDVNLDTNIANWYIGAVYYGQILQGGVTATSQWDSYDLTVQ